MGGSEPDTQDSPLDLLPIFISGRKLLLEDGGEGGSEKALEIVSLDRHLSLAGFRVSNPVYGGMAVRLVSSGFFDDTYPLPASGWRPIYVNGDLQGYVYEDPGQISGPITYARLASGKIKVVGQGTMLGHSLGETGPGCASVFVSLPGRTYLMSFGGTLSFKPFKAFKAVYADAPEFPPCRPWPDGCCLP